MAAQPRSNQPNAMAADRPAHHRSRQYAGTLARWMGLSDSQIKTVFPNFNNFGTNPYMSFMG